MTAPAFGATLWILSGAAISALAFYNLVTAVALIPFALWAAQRRSALVYGGAFGLLILGTEPMTVVATAMAVALVTFDVKRIALAIPVALVIASPQIVAYSEIAREVERARGYSAQTVLNASFDPRRILEVLIGPFLRDLRASTIQHLFLRVAMARPWAATAWKAYLPKLYAGRRPVDFDEYRTRVIGSLHRLGPLAVALTRARQPPALGFPRAVLDGDQAA